MFNIKYLFTALLLLFCVVIYFLYPRINLIQAYFLASPPDVKGQIIGREAENGVPYFIYLPPEYEVDSTREFPVTVHLHGALISLPSRFASDVPKADMQALAKAMEILSEKGGLEPHVIIAPYDGVGISMWSDSDTQSIKAETTLMKEILPWAVHNLRIRKDKQSTTIQGFSMGGFGAMKIGLKYPERFSRIISWDGAIHSWETLSTTRPGIVEKVFSSKASFESNSPWLFAKKLAQSETDKKFKLVFFTGTMQTPASYTSAFLTHLKNLNIPFKHYQTECPHSPFCLFSPDRVKVAYSQK